MTRSVSTTAALIVLVIGVSGCGVGSLDENARTAPTPSSSAALSESIADAKQKHMAATLEVLSADGFRDPVDGSNSSEADLIELKGSGELAAVTFQADIPILRQHFEDLQEAPDGAAYGVQQTGYGATSVAVFGGQQAVILTIIPDSVDAKPSLPPQAIVDRAQRLLAKSVG